MSIIMSTIWRLRRRQRLRQLLRRAVRPRQVVRRQAVVLRRRGELRNTLGNAATVTGQLHLELPFLFGAAKRSR